MVCLLTISAAPVNENESENQNKQLEDAKSVGSTEKVNSATKKVGRLKLKFRQSDDWKWNFSHGGSNSYFFFLIKFGHC